MYEKFKYQPQDFPYPLNEDMEKVYAAYIENDDVELEFAVSDIHLTLKHAGVNGVFSPNKVREMQVYFWGLLDD